MHAAEGLPRPSGCIDLVEHCCVPLQAAIASAVSFTVGGIIPLLGGVFIKDPWIRLAVVAVSLSLLHPSSLSVSRHFA